ncbi:hypothetical protein O3M35_010228 [Rhynocoris fuscipes]|uniref:Secreted protein n=1 Tax=Rhynocoris fuscipes TaxID=488301 RepID=A0AAW1D4A7_9HEMI
MKQILLSILTLSLLSIITVNGQGVLPAESAFSLDPLITLISCLREDKPGYCLQRRALNFFESWLTSQGGDEDENPAEDETGERLPAGLSPYWSKIVDSIADKISGSMYGDGEEEEPEDVEDVLLKNQNNTTNQLKVKSRQGESQVEGKFYFH